MRNRHLLNREIKIAALTTCHDHSELDLASITDAKSLFDNLIQEQYTGAEKRAALEFASFGTASRVLEAKRAGSLMIGTQPIA